MSAWLKSLASVIGGALLTGGAPAVGGADAKAVATSALAGAVVALINLWLHKPGTEPAK